MSGSQGLTKKQKFIRNILLTIAVICLFIWFFLGWIPHTLENSILSKIDPCQELLYSTSGNGFSVNLSPAGKFEYIGVSNGSFIFDNNRPNAKMKCEGALQFRQNNAVEAEKSWTQAVVFQDQKGFQQEESNDAEALIYREDSHVINSGLPYITFIVGTILTGDDTGIGYDVLQGAYAAQEEFNRVHDDPNRSPLQIRLLIANYSSNVIETPDTGKQIEDEVTQMIIQIAKQQDAKGVILGLPFTFDNTIARFEQQQIPVTLSGAFSESQLQNTNYIFPVSASTQREGLVGARYAQRYLNPKKIALFVDNNSLYSKNLADAFANNLPAGSTLSREIYTSRDPQSIVNGVNDALVQGDDLIYFAGDAKDADIALGILEDKNSSVRFLGGDALYELSGYTGKHYKSLYFTSFAFPDEWNQPGLPTQNLPTIYRLLYAGWPLKSYGYRRPDNNALLSYDASSILMNAGWNLFHSGYPVKFSLAALQSVLKHTQGNQAFQGFSGRISFGADIASKLVVVLYVTGDGFTQIETYNGCLLISCTP